MLWPKPVLLARGPLRMLLHQQSARATLDSEVRASCVACCEAAFGCQCQQSCRGASSKHPVSTSFRLALSKPT